MYLYHLPYIPQNTDSALFQVRHHPELWDQHTIRTRHPGTAHSQCSDIWLRYNDISSGNAVYLRDELFNGKDCIDYPAMKILNTIHPILNSLMFMVEGERLGRVIITRLPPCGVIDNHSDEGETAKYYDRFHVVLQEGGVFCAGTDTVTMTTGQVWWFDNQAIHSVVNDSEQDRIHLIVDIRLMQSSPFWPFKSHSYGKK